MGYSWLKSTDKYERISAWRSSDAVYDLVREGFFSSAKTRISARFVQSKPANLEMMLGTHFVRLHPENERICDVDDYTAKNIQILHSLGVNQNDIFYASTRAVPASYRAQFEEAVRTMCWNWFGRE